MNVLALVLAGGRGRRLHPLTAAHAKPAIRFEGGHRIVDFVLSNLVNSGIGRIYLLAQYKPQSLIAHIRAAWAPASRGPDRFVRVVLPRSESGRASFAGTADAVRRNLHLCARHESDVVAVFAADHVYRMDVGQMVEAHLRSGADISVAAVPVPVEQASRFGIIEARPDGRVSAFQEKPACPARIPGRRSHAYASMGNYLFSPSVLASLLDEAARRGETDFGQHVLPRAAATHRVFAYDFESNAVPGIASHEDPHYWRDVGTIDAYWDARHDATGPRPKFSLENERWPIGGQCLETAASAANAAVDCASARAPLGAPASRRCARKVSGLSAVATAAPPSGRHRGW